MSEKPNDAPVLAQGTEPTSPAPAYSTAPEYNAPTPVSPPAEHLGQGPEVVQPAPAAAPAPQKEYPGQPQPSPQPYYQPAVQSGYATAVPLHTLQGAPAPVDCPRCGQREMTKVEYVAGNTTHGWAAVLCCCFCLGCIPYLISSLKDVEHHCGKCGVLLAVWHNSGRNVVMQYARTQ